MKSLDKFFVLIADSERIYVAINNGFEWGNYKGIIGIMLDDVLAGTYSFIVLTLVFFLIGG